MSKKSWYINRRTLLKSASVCLALPWMECMAADVKAAPAKRFCAGYFAYGVPMPADDAPERMDHGWFPLGVGKDYEAPVMHNSIMTLRDKITFLSGLSHPSMRGTSAHKGADYFLTGANILKTYDMQSISIDQYLAQFMGLDTRYQSLVMSSNGGVNRPYRSSTLSFNRSGRPIPAQNNPQEIFRRLFGTVDASEKSALASRGSIIDEIFSEAKDVNRHLGINDKKKMDEYLTSVREVEVMTKRSIEWQKVPKAKVDPKDLDLEVNFNSPREYLTVMYDLIALAFQTDTTRVASFQTACENAGPTDQFPLAVGIKRNSHALSHEKVDYKETALYITFLNDLHANFIKKLDSIQEGDGTLLDNTLSLYGCATSKTHISTNYPIILAGGKNLGFKHGNFHKFNEEKIPLSNLFLTIAQKFGGTTETFADSNGTISEV